MVSKLLCRISKKGKRKIKLRSKFKGRVRMEEGEKNYFYGFKIKENIKYVHQPSHTVHVHEPSCTYYKQGVFVL
jgi:hypothetical protein